MWTAAEPEAVKGSGGSQSFSLLDVEPGSADDVVQAAERGALTFCDDHGGQFTADSLHLGQPKPDSEVAVPSMGLGLIECATVERADLWLIVFQAGVHACDPRLVRLRAGCEGFEIGIDPGQCNVWP